MAQIRPIPAVTYRVPAGGDLSALIAPPYDVLDELDKARLLQQSAQNIVQIDLPHLPAKTVGPDPVYQQAGETYRQWLAQGVLVRRDKPALFAYQQTFTVGGRTYQRHGLIANVGIQPFGPSPTGQGGIYPHEQTFSGPKEDRLKLMRATQAQLSPIFGLHCDPDNRRGQLLGQIIARGPASFLGITPTDQVRHEAWVVDDPQDIAQLASAFAGCDIFIADGHHRYTTALNYRNELQAAGKPIGMAGDCLFVLVALEDAGMIILPTHRVLGGMGRWDMGKFTQAAAGKLRVVPFAGGDLAALEAALPKHGPHALGLFDPTSDGQRLWIATTENSDPLAGDFPKASPAWRQLDVAIVQHLLVEQICQKQFCPPGQQVLWKFPHTLHQLQIDADGKNYQLGIIVQATPLEAVKQISQAGELMPQKSTFFYPKLATGLVINPLS